MNGYKLMADSYRKLVASGQMTAEDAKRDIEIYDFLATCSHDDIYTMVDSSAFNEIIKKYCRTALTEAHIDDDTADKVMDAFRWLFNDASCKEIMER